MSRLACCCPLTQRDHWHQRDYDDFYVSRLKVILPARRCLLPRSMITLTRSAIRSLNHSAPVFPHSLLFRLSLPAFLAKRCHHGAVRCCCSPFDCSFRTNSLVQCLPGQAPLGTGRLYRNGFYTQLHYVHTILSVLVLRLHSAVWVNYAPCSSIEAWINRLAGRRAISV